MKKWGFIALISIILSISVNIHYINNYHKALSSTGAIIKADLSSIKRAVKNDLSVLKEMIDKDSFNKDEIFRMSGKYFSLNTIRAGHFKDMYYYYYDEIQRKLYEYYLSLDKNKILEAIDTLETLSKDVAKIEEDFHSLSDYKIGLLYHKDNYYYLREDE